MITVQVKDEAAQRLIGRVAARLHDLREAYEDFGGRLLRSIQTNFDEQGRPDRWAPLKPQSLFASLARRKTYYDSRVGRFTAAGHEAKRYRKVLTDTGRLRRSIHKQISGSTLRIYTNVKYAAIHQFGGKTKPHKITAKKARALWIYPLFFKSVQHPGSKIPARPFLLVQRDDWEYFRRRLAGYLNGTKA